MILKSKSNGPLAFFLMLLFLPTWAARAADAGSPSTSPIAMTQPSLLADLAPHHPRLLADAARFTQLRADVKTDPLLKKWHESLKAAGLKLLDAPVSKYEIPDGRRLLATSRRVLDRVYTLAMLYQLDADPRFAQRAWAELDAASRFPDWNPQRHFLDTAEMTHAFAIGLDWLFDAWTPAQRDQLRHAIVEKGLEPGMRCYAGDTSLSAFWVKVTNNWNQVCNSGLLIGALAVADTDPVIAGSILHNSLEGLPRSIKEYGPDGACPEGPGYWHYATKYTVAGIAAMRSALGTDQGLSDIPGLDKAGLAVLYTTSPADRTFNFADMDNGEHPIRSSELFWLASRFGRDEFAWYQTQHASGSALDLLWYQPGSGAHPPRTLPLDAYFRHTEIVSSRSSWSDPDATVLYFKAGDNKANHSHLDLGSFVLDAVGKRFAIDYGADDYNLPGYFGGQRWTYYRLRAEGHNTLVINPTKEVATDQDPRAACPITSFTTTPDGATATTDLTSAYATQHDAPRKVTRSAQRTGTKVSITDRIETSAPSEIWWFMHTTADIQLNGNAATLTIGSARVNARIVSPADAVFVVTQPVPLPTSPNPKGQHVNPGVRTLSIHLTRSENPTIRVDFSPEKIGG